MSEINANIVVEPFDLTVTQTNNQITITPTALDLNIFTAAAIAGGGINDVQYNMGGTLGGIPTANYIAGNFNLGSTNTVKLLGGANAYFLQTDGTGNLTWAPGTANVSGNGTSAGANNEIQLTNGSGNFKAQPGFTFDTGINLFTVPGNAYVSGNINSNTNIIANGNVQGTYILGNGYYLTGLDPSQISNANSNVKVYANTITFSENGNANVVTIGPNQQMTVTTMNVNSLANFFGAVDFNAPVTMGSNLTVSGKVILNTIDNSLPIKLSTPTFTINGNTSNALTTTNVNVTGNIVATGNITGNRFTGNGSGLTSLTGANVTGVVPFANFSANANYAAFAGNANIANTSNIANRANTVTNNAQPNITSVGTLTNLSVSGNTTTANLIVDSGNAANANFKFYPNALTLNTAIGAFDYVQIANLGNTSNKTNTAVVFGDQGTNNYAATNDVYANIGGNKLYVGSQFFNLYGGNTTDKAAQSIYVWNVFDTNSDIANATVSTGTSLQIGSGVSVVRGAPLNDSGVLASFSYGGNTDPTNSVGYRMTRRRGNGAARLSLQPNDYLGNIEWRGAQANGALPTGNRFAKIGAKVDSTYVANTAAQPVGLEFVVVNSTANITHSFYSNGDVSFANSVNAIGNVNAANISATGNVSGAFILGDGGFLSNVAAGPFIANGNSNVQVYANANVAISIGGTSNTIVFTSNGISNLYTIDSKIHLGTNTSSYVNQGANSVAIGLNTGTSNQGIDSVALGRNSGSFTQGNRSIAIGVGAGFTNQGSGIGSAIAIGDDAAQQNQGKDSIAIGNDAGLTNQGERSIAIGYQAAATQQGANSIAIGSEAGKKQTSNSIAIGTFAGSNQQTSINSIAIGTNAGRGNTGFFDYQATNSIILNATGSNLNTSISNSFIVKPIRNSTSAYLLGYNPGTGEIVYADLNNYNANIGAYLIWTLQSTVANLPASPTGGSRAFVVDANTTTFNANVGGGGSNRVPVFFNGTNWRVG